MLLTVVYPQLFYSTYSFICAFWDHFPNKLPTLEFLSQESRLRQCTMNKRKAFCCQNSWWLIVHFSILVVLKFGEGNGTPLQYFCLENPMDGGACRLQSMGSLSRTRLSDFTFTFHFHALEKEMATHSSVLAWRIPGTGEPGGLPSMGSHRVGHDWSDLATAAAVLKFVL